MFQRVYNNVYYKDCSICPEWYWLSNFVVYINNQLNYQYFCNTCEYLSWSIDKESIKCDNKIYCPEYCRLVLMKDNIEERNSRYSRYIIAINSNRVILFSQKGYCFLKDYGLTPSGITNCLRGRAKYYKGYKWYYINHRHNKRLRIVHII